MGDAHLTPMTQHHVEEYPALWDERSVNQGVVVAAVHPESDGSPHLGTRVRSINGIEIGTLGDVDRALEAEGPHVFVTSHGQWVV
jgi:hypothetical protein